MDQQCIGITRSGERCKISRNLIDGYCHLHRKRVEDAVAASVQPAVDEPAPACPPPAPEEPSPTIPPDSRNTPMIVAAFVGIFLLIAVVINKVFSRRDC